MDTFRKHEQFEIEVLDLLKTNRFSNPLVFGGGTMLRLCHDLPRYSADLDFWFLKDIGYTAYFNKIRDFLKLHYELTDAHIKINTLLLEIRSRNYPRRLKIEIRKNNKEQDYQDKIAFSKYATKQVVLKTHTLNQTLRNKIDALVNRKEIRDGFDLEFILRKGIPLPTLSVKTKSEILKTIDRFTERDFRVTLGSTLESEMREYYTLNRFDYLKSMVGI